MKDSSERAENVVIAARVPPAIKENVEKLAKSAKRTSSQHIHYLIETHPEYVEAYAQETVLVA